nr:PREDICTED: myelin protein zero-like protein 2 isoform X4 [Lepisosteus oculatus]
MEVYTPEEVESVNGTDAKLKCTFQSSSPLKESSASVSWHFRPLGGGAEESVFFYQDGQYPPSEGRFRGRAVWAGNLNRYDGSIMVRDVQFRDNGTFVCQEMGCLTPQTDVLLRCFLLVFAAGGGAAIQVSAPPEVVGVKGREVTLKCTFWSSIHGTKLLSVDWSFRPESGGPSQSVSAP